MNPRSAEEDAKWAAVGALGCEMYSHVPDRRVPFERAALALEPVDVVYKVLVRLPGWQDELFRERLPFTFGHRLGNRIFIRAEVEQEVSKEQLSEVIDAVGNLAPIDAVRPEWAMPSMAISMVAATLAGLQEWRQG